VRVVFEVEHTARGNRYPGERGHRGHCLAARTPWNSLNARLTALAGWGEAVQQ
jgi:hypothetical protein